MTAQPDNTIEQDKLLGEAANEFFAEISRGKTPSVNEFAKRYPSIAEHIQCTFPMLAMLDDSVNKLDRPKGSAHQEPPQTLGDFKLLYEVGRGGMGVVYAAEQISMSRKVALKILPLAAMLDEKRLERFKNEVRAAATLDHPHCVPIYAVGEERGVHYYAMKLIHGQSISEVIEQLLAPKAPVIDEAVNSDSLTQVNGQRSDQRDDTPTANADLSQNNDRSGSDRSSTNSLSISRSSHRREYFRRIAELGAQAADALDHAHRLGVIHRDIKPANLLVDDKGELWITDFGLARIEADAGITMTGDLLGTLRYMSPEQALGKYALVDHRVDIYSLGVTLYELLTLKPAIQGEDRALLLKQLAESEPTAPCKIDASIPTELETIVRKAMEKNPSDRYTTAQELADDLRRLLSNKPILAKRSTLLGRTTKWVQRYPVWTALIAVVLLSISALSAGALWHAKQLSRELAVNEGLRLTAETQRAIAEIQQAKANRARYLSDMRLANRALLDGLPGEARNRLEQYLPQNSEADERDFPWYYLWDQFQHSLRRFSGHTGPVTSFALAEKAGLLISASQDKTVRFFDINDNSEIAKIKDFSGNVNAVVLSPDETMLFVGADTGALTAWDISTVAKDGNFKKVEVLEGHTDDVYCLAIAPEGKFLASAGAEGKVIVWELPSMNQARTLDGHDGWIRGLDFSPDGSLLASISHDDFVILWDILNGEEQHRIRVAKDRELGLSVHFHPSGEYIAAGNSHGEVHMIRLADQEIVSTFDGPESWFRSVDFSEDGTILAAAGNDPFINLLRVDSDMRLSSWQTLPGHQRETYCVRIAEDNKSLVSAGFDGSTVIRNNEAFTNHVGARSWNSEEIRKLQREVGNRRLTSSQNRDKLLLAGTIHTHVFDVADLNNPFIIATASKKSSSYGGIISPDGRWVGFLKWQSVRLSLAEPPLKRWKLTSEYNDSGRTQFYTAPAFHPSEDLIAIGSRDGQLSIAKIPSGEKLIDIEPFKKSRVADILYSADGRYLAACYCKVRGAEPATTIVWDVETFAEIGRVEGVVRLLAISPLKSQFALVNRDRSIQVWNAETLSTDLVLQGHSSETFSGDFSPDGRYLATAAEHGPIKVWSVDTGQLVLEINHDLHLPNVVFGPDYSIYATDIEILPRDPKFRYRHHLVPLLEPQPTSSQKDNNK